MRRQSLRLGERTRRRGEPQAAAGAMRIRWLRRTKSSTPSAEAKRAVPQVGSTWLGPAT